MNAGDTFFLYAPEVAEQSHLWVVLSDPSLDSENVLIVNLTSEADYQDHSCVLQPGDHPFIKHASCVNYPGARRVTLAALQDNLKRKAITPDIPVTAEVLRRMREGAACSGRMRLMHRQILIDQVLIE